MTENDKATEAVELEIQIDPLKMQAFRNKLDGQQNMPMGLAAGLIAAFIGGAIWAAVTVATKYQIGWMAIGVGAFVGYAVKVFGKGISNSFGITGATCALLGCAFGNLLSTCGFIAIQESASFFSILQTVLTKPGLVSDLFKETFNPMDLLFYGIAMYEAYIFSFRQITQEELATLAVDN